MDIKEKHLLGLKQRIDFEHYKNTYRKEIQKSIDFIGQDLEFFTQVKAENLIKLASRRLGNLSKLKILDVGCGIGLTDYYLIPHFKKIHGVDLSRGVVHKAALLNPKASYKAYPGKILPYPTGSMDITFAVCVMHHVAFEEQNRFVSEMVRVTRKNGLIVIFDHNPLNPLTRYAVSRCELDEDAVLLRGEKVKKLLRYAGTRILEKKYILFTPYRGKFFALLEILLSWVPLGAQYFVAGRK